MISRAEKHSGQQTSKVLQAHAAFEQLLSDASRRGFFGGVTMSVSVQDGHVQHFKVSTERMIK